LAWQRTIDPFRFGSRAPACHLPYLSYWLEDSAILTELLSRLIAEASTLELSGTATTPQAALLAIEALHPDITVLDLMLDGGVASMF
jgi:hypothetical protein